MDYEESLDYLFSLAGRGIKLGLSNTSALLGHFGNPHHKVPAIHIAGTNGKGSTAAFVESILRAAGFRTGLYTSPHLLDFRERIQIDRQPIARDAMVSLITRVRQAAEQLEIDVTYFEFSTVMAFLYFSEQEVDWNIIEVGLGGRLDSTNLCQAKVCIITSLSRDHEDQLGSDLKHIAFEKAAIIKHPTTVVSGVKDKTLVEVIQKQAQKNKAQLVSIERDFQVTVKSCPEDILEFDYASENSSFEGLKISLLGPHQAENASLAVAACGALPMLASRIPEKIIRSGLASARWPGRLEVISRSPVVVLDCAHNPAGFRALAEALKSHFPKKRCILVLGIMKDKQVSEITGIIPLFADYIIVTRPHQERSADPAIVRDQLAGFSKPVEIVDEVSQAVLAAKRLSKPEDLICITGSIFTIAEAKQSLEDKCVS